MPDLRQVVENFVAAAARPAMLDPGEEPLLLISDQWSVSEWNGRLMLQAWDRHRNLVRKIVAVREQRRDRLCLITERFQRPHAEMQIADLGAPDGRDMGRRASRMAFCERFRLMLAREWPEWQIAEVSADANLEESLSTSYTRAFLRLGQQGMAVMAALPSAGGCAAIVPAALIWLDYLRRREPGRCVGTLLVYVPVGEDREVAFRVACLDPAKAACHLFAFDERDRAGLIDLADAGNIDSTLPSCHQPAFPNMEPFGLPEMPDVDFVSRTDGAVSLRVRGLEFARAAAGRLTCGISRRKQAGLETVVSMAREIVRVRNSEADDCRHPLYSLNPEGWLESQVRRHPEAIDASLRPVPIYGQVPVFSGPDRGVVDLLGIDHTGRLVVIELKATADLQLPFQALDYWLRVQKHLQAGDFERLGYFAGHTLSREAPRILLLAPALEFHSTTEILLNALRPEIEVTRAGLAAGWRSGLRVMFRLRGAERP